MTEQPDWERWRGEMDAFVAESRADRAGLHSELRRGADRAEERHAETIHEIRELAHAQRDAMQVVRTEAASAALTAHRRADDAHGRIDRWEARAEGAG